MWVAEHTHRSTAAAVFSIFVESEGIGKRGVGRGWLSSCPLPDFRLFIDRRRWEICSCPIFSHLYLRFFIITPSPPVHGKIVPVLFSHLSPFFYDTPPGHTQPKQASARLPNQAAGTPTPVSPPAPSFPTLCVCVLCSSGGGAVSCTGNRFGATFIRSVCDHIPSTCGEKKTSP